MISLCISFAVLIVGYLVYGRVAEKIFAPDDRKTLAMVALWVATVYLLKKANTASVLCSPRCPRRL